MHLASSSRGVSAHFVVRVVVIALESVPTDSAESGSSSTTHRSLILKLTPKRRRRQYVGGGAKFVQNDNDN